MRWAAVAEAALRWAVLCGLYTVLISTVAVPALLLAGCLVVGLVPAVGRPIAAAAARFTDRSGYLGAVLDGAAAPPLPAPPADRTGSGILLGLLSTALAAALAATALHRPLPAPAWGRHAVRALRRLHSGLLGDYVTWLLVGLAGLLAAVAALS
ncbi:hypothetical protein [Kitasatospora cineracea]|uniref:Sensor protein n=1 Tax=Kitasatospora cineracea TaxID=88074 RepID=A0A8G1ULJ1_9ACTN|nr:hypothetical protein [Kitasatospora cineracea]ROR46156.1 hypothetical protein EDD39_4416 [Kitasatospora cineracea]